MLRLSIPEIIEKIENEIPFQAETQDGSFYIKVNDYVPYVCTAIHNGCRLRSELIDKINLDEFERWYEEDPFTGDMISSLPIVLVGRDSRFEYDLNRSPENAIYEDAWGKKVWKRKLNKTQRKVSLTKHANYYKVTHALISKLETLFEGAVVYDLHSYNYKRWGREVPLFNIGSEKVPEKFGDSVENWRDYLAKIELDYIENKSEINDVFQGRGYNLEYITKHFSNTLVLATEIKKVYCDEESGEQFPKVVNNISLQLKNCILTHASGFAHRFTNWNNQIESSLLTNKLDPSILKVDKKLAQLVKNFELLNYVNPINIKREKVKFFKNNYQSNPEFKYKHVEIDPIDLKRKLLSLEVEKIDDIAIRKMYVDTINGYIDKIDMLVALGTEKFLFSSLRYFGKPSESDLKNARLILLLPTLQQDRIEPKSIKADRLKMLFSKNMEEYGFQGKIAISKKIAADVMVLNSQKKVIIRDGVKISATEGNALVHHEIGVHMLTTMNSTLQKLKIFNVGLPTNTCTQEGLAVLAELTSGNMTLKKLKKLAYRVIAVNLMCDGYDFKDTFKHLHYDLEIDKESAFTITTRVYRGGGFTKDYLYLRGFCKLFKFWRDGQNLIPLLVGKTSLEYYHTINEMVERGLVSTPKYVTDSFKSENTAPMNPVLEYIISGMSA